MKPMSLALPSPTLDARLASMDAFLVKVTERIAAVGVAGILGVAVLTVTQIVLRAGFKISLYGLNEINALMIAVAVTACLPSGVARRINLTVDLFDQLKYPAVVAWMRAFGAGVLWLFLALLAWRLGVHALNSHVRNETTIMTLLPTAPFFAGCTIGLTVCVLVQAVVTLRCLVEALSLSKRISGVVALAGWTIVIIGSGVLLAGLVKWGGPAALVPSSKVVFAAVAFGVMWITIMMFVPLGAAMGLTGLIGAIGLLGLEPALSVLGSEAKRYLTDDALSVLPLFLLMGTFASVAGIGRDIYRLFDAFLGHLRGGLAHATIGACAAFGALTGSSLATQMTIGRIAMPEMRQRGYSTELSTGSIAAGGTLGQLVPPGTAMILYAVMAEESVGKMFMASILPGILAALLYMATVWVWVQWKPEAAPKGPRVSWSETGHLVRDCWQAVVLLLLVLGGLFAGFFTELEAGSVGAVGAFLMALMRGKITRETLWGVMGETTSTIALMYTLLFGTALLSFFFGITQLPQFFLGIVDTYHLSPLGVVLVLIAAYLILGTAMDSWAMMVITVPIFVPVVVNSGFNPIWWGIMTIVCMEAGQISPPFGLNIFVINSIAPEVPMTTVFRGCWPFFWTTLLKIALLIAFPALCLWLPGLK
jgi:tripartite ATP-independent transporter DctM subunit